MESEQSENFNERLSQWVANQGFWFQVRYSLTGSGTKGTAVFHLLRMSFRLLILLLVVAAGISIYLFTRTEYKAFNVGLKSSLSRLSLPRRSSWESLTGRKGIWKSVI
jgi:hypothetical protein